MKEREWEWVKPRSLEVERKRKENKLHFEELDANTAVREWVASLPSRAVKKTDVLRPLYGRAAAIKMMIERRPMIGHGARSEVGEHLDAEARGSERARPMFGLGLKFRPIKGAGSRKGEIQVAEVLPYGPACRSRMILVGDVVVSVDRIRASDLPLSELHRVCLGPKGTECILRLARKAGWDVAGKQCGAEFDVRVPRGPLSFSVASPETTLEQCDWRSETNICGGNLKVSNLGKGRVAGDTARTSKGWRGRGRGL